MNRMITDEQIDSIINALFELNVPIKMFSGVQKMFKELPLAEEKKQNEDLP